jgi:hypothetical protein
MAPHGVTRKVAENVPSQRARRFQEFAAKLSKLSRLPIDVMNDNGRYRQIRCGAGLPAENVAGFQGQDAREQRSEDD